MASEVIRVSLKGSLPGGEKWSINPCFHNIAETDVSFSEVLAIGTAINAVTIPTTVRQLWSVSTSYTGVQVEARSSQGVLESLADVPRSSIVPGTGAGALPFQASCVVSLRTNRPGGSGRGRLYLPATGVTLGSSGLRIDPTVLAAAADGMKTWLSGIQGAVEATLTSAPLAVWSRTTFGTFSVTKILMGDVVDVQRRRRDQAPEAYQERSYP